MKTKFFTTVFLVVAALWSVDAQPSELFNNKVDVQLDHNNQMRIMYMDAANEVVSFKIFDTEGEIIEERTYLSQGHLKIGVLVNNLPDGHYDVKIYSGKKLVRIERIELSEGKLAGLPVLVKSATINYALL